jgi:hypothetical protein
VEERRAKLKREEQGSTIEELSNLIQKRVVQQQWGDDEETKTRELQAPVEGAE